MQNISGEAMAMYDESKLSWCHAYTAQLRELQVKKYDEITAKILEYMDTYIKKTPEEMEKEKNNNAGKKKGGDPTKKQKLELNASRPDIMFGIFANVSLQGMNFSAIPFGSYSTQLPSKVSNQSLILRCLWTSYDYLTPNKIQDDIVVGGIIDFQMYAFPELSKQIKNSWTIRRVYSLEERLRKIPFPDASHTEQIPVECVFILPKTVFTSDDTSNVKIAIWDRTNKCWTSEPI